jgi:hypothetical protein
MPASPPKPAHQLTEDELREWKQRLFTDGVKPVPIRQDASTSVSSYGWDPDLNTTVEYANGNRYIVGVRDGKLTRLASVEPAAGSEETRSRPATATSIPPTQTAHPNPPGVRKRKLA